LKTLIGKRQTGEAKNFLAQIHVGVL